MVTPDNREKFSSKLNNSELTNIKGRRRQRPAGDAPGLDDNHQLVRLERVMGGMATFDQLIQEGKANLEGNRRPFDVLRSAMARFTPDFELLSGTKPEKHRRPRPVRLQPREGNHCGPQRRTNL